MKPAALPLAVMLALAAAGCARKKTSAGGDAGTPSDPRAELAAVHAELRDYVTAHYPRRRVKVGDGNPCELQTSVTRRKEPPPWAGYVSGTVRTPAGAIHVRVQFSRTATGQWTCLDAQSRILDPPDAGAGAAEAPCAFLTRMCGPG